MNHSINYSPNNHNKPKKKNQIGDKNHCNSQPHP